MINLLLRIMSMLLITLLFCSSVYAWEYEFRCPVNVKKVKYNTEYIKSKKLRQVEYWKSVKSKDEYGRVIKDEDGEAIYINKKFKKNVYENYLKAKRIEEYGFNPDLVGKVLQSKNDVLVFFVNKITPTYPDNRIYYGVEERTGVNVNFYSHNYDNTNIEVGFGGKKGFAWMRVHKGITFHRATSSTTNKNAKCRKTSKKLKTCDAAIVYKGSCTIKQLF